MSDEHEPDPLLIGLRGFRCRELIRPILARNGVTWQEIIVRNRLPRYVAIRESIYGTLHTAGWSLPRIGRLVGGRDHTTVHYGLTKWKQRRQARVSSNLQRPEAGHQEKSLELLNS